MGSRRDLDLTLSVGSHHIPTSHPLRSLYLEQGRISIIAWGWVDQYDELDAYLDASDVRAAPQRESHAPRESGRGGGWGREDKDGQYRRGASAGVEPAERVSWSRTG